MTENFGKNKKFCTFSQVRISTSASGLIAPSQPDAANIGLTFGRLSTVLVSTIGVNQKPSHVVRGLDRELCCDYTPRPWRRELQERDRPSRMTWIAEYYMAFRMLSRWRTGLMSPSLGKSGIAHEEVWPPKEGLVAYSVIRGMGTGSTLPDWDSPVRPLLPILPRISFSGPRG
jgi:hypothetical protein